MLKPSVDQPPKPDPSSKKRTERIRRLDDGLDRYARRREAALSVEPLHDDVRGRRFSPVRPNASEETFTSRASVVIEEDSASKQGFCDVDVATGEIKATKTKKDKDTQG